MKDGRTHLAHKAEHAVDLDTGAIVAVTLQGADQGDTTTIVDTVVAATAQVEAAQIGVDDPQSLDEIIADKGYHSNQTMVDLDAVGIRYYIAEPDRGRRDVGEGPGGASAGLWESSPHSRPTGTSIDAATREKIERTFAHLYDTGGMRRTHLRGHTNILKRLLIHAGAFNLGLVMRHGLGVGTPRGLQDCGAVVIAVLVAIGGLMHLSGRAEVHTHAVPCHRSRRIIDTNCYPSASTLRAVTKGKPSMVFETWVGIRRAMPKPETRSQVDTSQAVLSEDVHQT